MASLLIRNVDDALHTRLKARATANHRSLEEEVRETLRLALARTNDRGESLVELATRLFGTDQGTELELPPRSLDLERPPPDFAGPEFDH